MSPRATWSGRKMNQDLVSAVFVSMAFAVVASFCLTAISIVALALGYRSDALILKRQLHGAFI
jgi:hypothetical protein